ncbi:hypothetical protein [Bradyrhizobium sp. AS23.2]|nr:hypothetical protein [Bradyrhizobium sp. AS23.2]
MARNGNQAGQSTWATIKLLIAICVLVLLVLLGLTERTVQVA